eukprot:4031909-Alexandrium_andersonii.AAC.1
MHARARTHTCAHTRNHALPVYSSQWLTLYTWAVRACCMFDIVSPLLRFALCRELRHTLCMFASVAFRLSLHVEFESSSWARSWVACVVQSHEPFKHRGAVRPPTAG